MESAPRWKVILGIIAGALVTASIIFGVVFVVRRSHERAAKEAKERDQRQAPVTIIAPAPLPTGLPLAGAEGVDADGYPTQYVDRPALRSLLWHKRYDELTRDVEELQARFEADPTKEYWPIDAADAFESTDPELLASLDAWVAAAPASFAPYLARGTYWTDVAHARRGADRANKTASSDFDAMGEAFVDARKDLSRAVALRPKLVAAMRRQIQIAGTDAKPADKDAALKAALAACPSCFQVRVHYTNYLAPRWGGTYAAMSDFARASAKDAPQSKLRLLAGYVAKDEAKDRALAKDFRGELDAAGRACAVGDHWEFLLERAKARTSLDDLDAALDDLNRADALRPQQPDVLFERAWVQSRMNRSEPAARDLLAGLRIDATHWRGRSIYTTVVKALLADGTAAHEAGQRDDAVRLLDLAAELAPGHGDIDKRRDDAILGIAMKGHIVLSALEDAAKRAPDDFAAQRRFDNALHKARKMDRILELWDDYLARHPDDGRAYRERSGANFNSRKLDAAYADAAKACELGWNEGCFYAKAIHVPQNK